MILVSSPGLRERAEWLAFLARGLGRPVLACRDMEELRAVAEAREVAVSVVFLDAKGEEHDVVEHHVAVVKETFPTVRCLVRSARRPEGAMDTDESDAGDVWVYWVPIAASASRALLMLHRILPPSLSGQPVPLPLGDLLQLACFGSVSARIACLQGGRTVGHIDVVDGEPWSARDTVSDGEEALSRLLAGCEVGVALQLSPEHRSIRTLRGQCQQLLLDAVRRHDETTRSERDVFPSAEWDALWGGGASSGSASQRSVELRRRVAEAILSGDRARAHELLDAARDAASSDPMLRMNLARLEALAQRESIPAGDDRGASEAS